MACSPAGGAAVPGSGTADGAFAEAAMTKARRDAREWLNEDGPKQFRTIGERTNAESEAIVDDLFHRGAIRVYATEIDTVAGVGQTTNMLVVELPADARSRRRLLDVANENARRNGFDPVSDDGQAYLALWKFKSSYLQVLRQLLGSRRHADRTRPGDR